MAKKYIMLPEEREAIERSIERILNHATGKSLSDTLEVLNTHGIPNGAFQDYYLLNLLLELQSKLIAVKKEMEVRYNG